MTENRDFSEVIRTHRMKLALATSITATATFLAVAIGEWRPLSPWAAVFAGLPIGIITVIFLNEKAIRTYTWSYVQTCTILLVSAVFLYFAVESLRTSGHGEGPWKAAAVLAVAFWCALNYWRNSRGQLEQATGTAIK